MRQICGEKLASMLVMRTSQSVPVVRSCEFDIVNDADFGKEHNTTCDYLGNGNRNVVNVQERPIDMTAQCDGT